MSPIWIWTLTSVIVVSLISLVGVITIFYKEQKQKTLIWLLVSLAVGALFGDAFIHLIPEIYSDATHPVWSSFFILAGICIFFIMEKFLNWHHYHHSDHSHETIKPLGYLNLISDGIHNLIDGIIIAVAYLVSLPVGIATTITVILHEIPQEISDFGLLLHAGFSKTKAIWLNLLSASIAIIGAALALIIGHNITAVTEYALATAAGGFIYIAGSDLVPELHKEIAIKKTLLQFVMVGIGVGLMFAMLLIE
ncbi:MAG: ZIP family metal transporter [Candidatus Komeilibacteria bacterium]